MYLGARAAQKSVPAASTQPSSPNIISRRCARNTHAVSIRYTVIRNKCRKKVTMSNRTWKRDAGINAIKLIPIHRQRLVKYILDADKTRFLS